MVVDELREKLKLREQDIAAIKAYWNNTNFSSRFAELDAIVTQESFWKHPDRDTLLSEHHHLKELNNDYTTAIQTYNDCQEMVELFANDEGELTKIQDEVAQTCRNVAKFKLELLLNKPSDASNCYITINAGAGGTESQDWADMLLRMYLRFCERENFKIDVLDCQSGEEAGIKSATLYIRKKNATGLLKSEAGTHRLVRISPYDANKRRHTSFAGVSITPEVADATIEILDKDLRIDTYRAGGAGGQHVNKTDSAVRITHMPSGIVVQCQNERSQTQNKQVAIKMLKARLVEKQEAEKRAREDAIEKKKIEWGSQIRSYVLHPYKMVKDHRTEHESPQPDLVLDGELMPFIEAYLIQNT